MLKRDPDAETALIGALRRMAEESGNPLDTKVRTLVLASNLMPGRVRVALRGLEAAGLIRRIGSTHSRKIEVLG